MEISNIEKWHWILCHPISRDLKYLYKAQLLNGKPARPENKFFKCEFCLENKMTNLKFKKNHTRAKNLFQIIHVHGLDSAGCNGERYFITFIDNFSQIAVVYCT